MTQGTVARACAVATAFACFCGPRLAAAAPHSDSSLRARLGVTAAETLLRSEKAGDRLRGIERLGATGTARATSRLIHAVQPGGAATSEERLTAVRALAGLTNDPSVRRALSRVLGGHASSSPSDATSLDELSQDTAALALARAGTDDALAALGKALESSGRASRSAAGAIVAHPPRRLAPLLDAARTPTLALATALGDLGDQRAFATLRSLVRAGSPEVSAAAALGLTRLGDYETVELARRWGSATTPRPLRVAGARILAMSRDAGSASAIAALLRVPDTLTDGIALSLEAPDPALVPELARALEQAAPDRAADLLAAIGRSGGASAVTILTAQLAHPERGPLAAAALARMPSDGAEQALLRALGTAATRVVALRALTLRALLSDRAPGALGETAERVLGSKDPRDRAAASAALAVTDPERLEGFLASRDDAVVRACAGLVLLLPDSAVARVAERLAATTSNVTRTALAIALAAPSAEGRVDAATLRALVDAEGAASPLAARALAMRDDPDDRAFVDTLAQSPDPWIRAHAALGLGQSREPSVTGRLETAYRFEPDGSVRRAIVRALSRRRDPTRLRVLELAGDLDPDPGVRSLARLAARGAALAEPARGTAALFLPVGESRGGPALALLGVKVSGGLVVPAATASDGLAIVAALPEGPIALRVAPAQEADNDLRRGASGNQEGDPANRTPTGQ